MRLPPKLTLARSLSGTLLDRLIRKFIKKFRTARAQKGFDETFHRMAKSPTWETLCRQVFDQYLGQLSFTPVTQIHLLAEKLKIEPHNHVLDLAPGTGGLSLYLARLTGCRLTGLDLSPKAVQIANRQAVLQRLAERVNFEAGVLPSLPYKECSFDAIVSIDSVYTVADKIALFRDCYRVLRPDGRLGFYTLYEQRDFSSESIMHIRAHGWFPSRPYSRLLEDVGFEGILKRDLTKGFIQLARQWFEAILENKVSLKRELGEKITKSLLMDIGMAWALARDGYVGRALFKGQKPPLAFPRKYDQ